MPQFTILIPTFDHGETIRFPLECVRGQTRQDYEVFIVGDGVPPESEKRLKDYATADGRISFFPFPKHVSRGEPNRHEVLQRARGEIVCYLTDRDLWLPDHLERIQVLLASADFAHSLGIHVLPEDELRFFPVDLANINDRDQMLHRFNRVPLSCAAHRLDFYHRLPRGWETTPPQKPTDWHMFQQFLEQPDCRTLSGTYPSAITFPSPPRRGWTGQRRLEELARWTARTATPVARQTLVQEVLEATIRGRDAEREELLGQIAGIHRSVVWRMGRRLRNVPGIRVLRSLLR